MKYITKFIKELDYTNDSPPVLEVKTLEPLDAKEGRIIVINDEQEITITKVVINITDGRQQKTYLYTDN